MVSQNSSAALQQQMHNVRQNMTEQADEIVKKARIQFDWRHYVAKHPWAALGAAAALGFFLVPRRACCKGLEPEARTKVVDRVGNSAPSALSNLAVGVATVIATTFVREGVGLVSQIARQWLDQGGKLQGGIPAENDKSA